MRGVSLLMLTAFDGFIAGPNGEADDEPSATEHPCADEAFRSADAVRAC